MDSSATPYPRFTEYPIQGLAVLFVFFGLRNISAKVRHDDDERGSECRVEGRRINATLSTCRSTKYMRRVQSRGDMSALDSARDVDKQKRQLKEIRTK